MTDPENQALPEPLPSPTPTRSDTSSECSQSYFNNVTELTESGSVTSPSAVLIIGLNFQSKNYF